MNPRVGSGLQHARAAREEKAAEVVENHEGGTSREVGTSRPKVDAGRPVETWSGLPRDRDDGGANLWTTPREVSAARAVDGRTGDIGKDGAKVTRVGDTEPIIPCRAEVMVLEGA